MGLVPLRLNINLGSVLIGRLLCMMIERLNDGFVVASWHAYVGDHIFVARGSGSSFILRRMTKRGKFQSLEAGLKISDFYRFASAAYV